MPKKGVANGPHRTALGRRIRRRRRDLDITQHELALLTEIPQYHISAIESGRIKEIKTGTLWRLAQALRVTADSLIAQDGEDAQETQESVPAPVG